MSAPALAVAAIAVAAALDWLVREPPERVHPVAWFGRAVGAVDREWRRPRVVGLVAAIALPLAAAGVVGLTVLAASRAGAAVAAVVPRTAPAEGAAVAAVAVGGLALFTTTSLRSLLEAVDGVVAAAATDLHAARERLPSLVGRDPADLDADHVRSAAVESGAENLADGLVAPLLAFAITPTLLGFVGSLTLLAAAGPSSLGGAAGSLAAGAAGAAWIKAVNTMDSMLGYPDVAVGTAAARLDDVAMWVPARVAALTLAAAAASPAPATTARRWADAPASPNAGWPMATLAAALDVRLAKPGAYDLNPTAPFPDAAAARRGVALVGRAGLLAYGLAALLAYGVPALLTHGPPALLTDALPELLASGLAALLVGTPAPIPEVVA